MSKDATLLEELGRHGRRSRVIWHPGSIPPYSSLWVTIQRFLMLNQPSRAAFAQDFLWRKTGGSEVVALAHTSPRPPINDYQMAGEQDPIRLRRFARVLKESAKAFRGCHIGDFPKMARPYFGDFAVCPHCLAEGFHSVLYSFEGIRVCPAHGTNFETLQSNSVIASDLFTHALRNPFGGCQYLQEVLGYPEARIPKAHARRDSVLGEIADWLMDVDSRCWLGHHGVRQVDPFDGFTKRLVHLKTILRLPNAVPKWVGADGLVELDSSTTEIIRFGSVKVFKGDLVDIDDKRALRHQTDLNDYGRTIFGDFKAIRRYLKRCDLGRHGRHWLGRLSKATSVAEVTTLLDQGGEQAGRAWMLLAWSRQINEREFNPKVGLYTRPMRFAIDGNIPLWVANLKSGRHAQGEHDFVHLWIARWISAADLLAFWRSICMVEQDVSSPDIVVVERALLEIHCEPKWSLGISASDELILCFDNASSRRSKPALL